MSKFSPDSHLIVHARVIPGRDGKSPWGIISAAPLRSFAGDRANVFDEPHTIFVFGDLVTALEGLQFPAVARLSTRVDQRRDRTTGAVSARENLTAINECRSLFGADDAKKAA